MSYKKSLKQHQMKRRDEVQEEKLAVKSFYNKRTRLQNKINEYVAKITDYQLFHL